MPRRYGDYRPGNFASGFRGPVSASEALATSLNLPAVQLLEAYGPKRFAGQLRGAGVPLQLPGEAEPNLALVLGGGGSRLEDLLVGYSALAREGRTARLRLQPQDALHERRLLSPGAAWIVRRILSGQARPDRDPRARLLERPQLAWKTGTSYGFRDAWAIGVGPRYLVGVWIGRPDGTPVAGQFGLASAAPLLLQVHDLLLSRDAQRGLGSPLPQAPASVGVAAICWPLGQPLARDDDNCRRQRFAWTLDGTTPPTLQAADQPLGLGLRQTLWLNARGQQVDAACAGARAQRLDLWPAPLEPWLPRRERRAARLPAVATECPPQQATPAPPPLIVGVREGARLRRPAGAAEPLALELSVLGGSGRTWWFLDGQPLGETGPGEVLRHDFARAGRFELSALDESGQTARVGFEVLP